ncbi:1,4-dihydroxy-2-naphthoate octaprenyltransferase [Candidatus Bathyarchaeota archaeon RBG_16_48_13]|nr:MAG: 1,4-dihydroxy-2-naphthoate octaprenyltransferase [Candidatus Bathyarchaeota archaeon RBG_16_48_13]
MKPIHGFAPSSLKVKIPLLLAELRAPFLTASLASVFLGTAMAWVSWKNIDPIFLLLTLAGTFCLHSSANVINDYFDYKSGCDGLNRDSIPPFTGGSGLLVSGALRPNEVLALASSLFLTAGAIGLYLAMIRGWIILVLVAVAVLSGYFYTTHLATRGVGELVVGLCFGPLLAFGTYYVQTNSFALGPLLAGLPLGLLVAAILWINEIPDYRADSLVGKNTAVVRLGKRRAAQVYVCIVGLAYAIIGFGILARVLPVTSALTFLSLPLALKAARIANTSYDSKELRPANGLTISTHLVVGILLTTGYILLPLLPAI